MSTLAVKPEQEAFPYPPTDLLETDGEPFESDWHRLAMNLLIDTVSCCLRGRQDYFVGGNMFIYFNAQQARNLDYRGPDFFFVWDRPLNPPRPYWAVWDEEGRYPDVVIELSSPRTAREDLTTKKDIYERIFRTHEYFVYNPADRKLQGWRLVNRRFEAIAPNERGWLWCEELGLWLGVCDSVYCGKEAQYLRFFDAEGRLAPTLGEAAQAEAEAAHAQAETARKETDAHKARADAAEAELAKLKGQLTEGGKNGNP